MYEAQCTEALSALKGFEVQYEASDKPSEVIEPGEKINAEHVEHAIVNEEVKVGA